MIFQGVQMKRYQEIFLGLGIIISCIAYIFYPFTWNIKNISLGSTIDTYMITHRQFPILVDCQSVLNRAASRYSSYDEVSAYMKEDCYKYLNLRTKSNYDVNVQWDNKVMVIYQKQDPDDPSLIYVDIMRYNTKYEEWKPIALDQLMVQKENGTWKIIHYFEQIDNGWYAPTQSHRVWYLVLQYI